MEYEAVIAGGTFDRLHVGHETFLDKAFTSGKKVLIGLTSKEMLKKTVRPGAIWSYERRKEEVEKFIKKYGKPYEIHKIDDIFGFSTEVKNSYAIVATEETKYTCETINKIRTKKGLNELEIIMVPFVYSEDCRVISSSRIRKGEVDRKGRLLIDYKITEKLREELKKPVGKIFEGDNKFATENVLSYLKEKGIHKVICVGDQVSYDLINNNHKPKNIIIDGRVMRKPIGYKQSLIDLYPNKFTLENPPGLISIKAWRILREALKKESVVFVEGEDDLLVFTVGLLVDNNTAIIYGQPARGKVLIEIDDFKREELRKMLSEFDTIPR